MLVKPHFREGKLLYRELTLRQMTTMSVDILIVFVGIQQVQWKVDLLLVWLLPTFSTHMGPIFCHNACQDPKQYRLSAPHKVESLSKWGVGYQLQWIQSLACVLDDIPCLSFLSFLSCFLGRDHSTIHTDETGCTKTWCRRKYLGIELDFELYADQNMGCK